MGKHIAKCVSKANQMVGWVTRNLIMKDMKTMMTVYKSLVRPQLEYCVQLWNPEANRRSWKTIMEIEKVQRDFTRRINGIGLLPYSERLIKCQITTLVERRARGDLIECFKIWKGLVNYGSDLINVSRSGYNLLLMAKKGSKLHSMFPGRIVNYWNHIPDEVKDFPSVESFKVRLDYYASRQSTGHFWELSGELLRRIDSNQQSRDGYVNFMIENPNVAKRRYINV